MARRASDTSSRAKVCSAARCRTSQLVLMIFTFSTTSTTMGSNDAAASRYEIKELLGKGSLGNVHRG